jgi:hypothetical protein
LAECLEYSSLLDQAVLVTSSIERFHLIIAFIVSNLSTHLERMSKPFNPLLGETYELKNEDTTAPFHYIAEQVSHHPPISALHVRGQNWILTANVEPKIKFHGTNVVALSEGEQGFQTITISYYLDTRVIRFEKRDRYMVRFRFIIELAIAFFWENLVLVILSDCV